MRGNPVKHRLAAGGLAFGTMLFEFASPGIARIAAGAGAEFLILDMEHSSWGFETVKQQLAAARAAGIVAMVNPPNGAFENVGRCLDLGAQGLMIPVVETKEQAEALVVATRYPPHGHRGSAFGVAHDDYAADDPAASMARANENTLLIVKIETAKGVANADAILGVAGIDVGFVGHTDLSVSLGMPGQFARSSSPPGMRSCAPAASMARRPAASRPAWRPGWPGSRPAFASSSIRATSGFSPRR